MIKNWRGLEPHPVDEWDHWTYSLKDYEKIKAVYDAVAPVGRDKLLAFAEMVSRFEAAEHAEEMAGDSI